MQKHRFMPRSLSSGEHVPNIEPPRRMTLTFHNLFVTFQAGTWYANAFVDLIALFDIFVVIPFTIYTLASMVKAIYQMELEKELRRRGKS
jgi:hypothetical protein